MEPERRRQFFADDVEPPERAFTINTHNPDMRRLLAYAGKVAQTPYPVLIQGETGTGKELIARGIHIASGRKGMFAPVNCGAIPENLFEAELFGARRGAYTGLDSDRPGLFQIADQGTLFLDEIAEMPASTQAKLLRVLQDGEVRPLGSSRAYRVQVRIIAATHKDLEKLVEEGDFRMDLYFRISTAALHIPPLRERPEDIPILLEEAAAEAAEVQGLPSFEIGDDVIAGAREYAWPGNVRELMHAVATAMLSAGARQLSWKDFHGTLGHGVHRPPFQNSLLDLPFPEARDQFERTYLTNLLQKTAGNLSRAAKLAGLPRSTLRDKLRRNGIASLGDGAPRGPRSLHRLRAHRRASTSSSSPYKG
jgi:sigma-54-dependent transcriptional regulator